MPVKKPRNFMVPGEVHAAVLTGRAELVNSLRNRIESGGAVIDKDIALQLCDLVKESIKESQRDHARRQRFAARLRDCILGPLRGAASSIEQAMAEILQRDEMPDDKMRAMWDELQHDYDYEGP